MAETLKQVVVLNAINQVFNRRLHLMLRGFRVVEFVHLEDLVNWLETCAVNTINVAAIILIIQEADPLLSILSEFPGPICVIGTDEALECELNKVISTASGKPIVFCCDENQLEAIFHKFS
jgi:hypothetical protein